MKQHSGAGAALGDNNTATTLGDNSDSIAGGTVINGNNVYGSNDTASATGPNSNATAGPGDGYTATAGPNQTVTSP